MGVKNLMEDIVSALVDEVIAKTGEDAAYLNKDDIKTYVLNRIPPKYYTSERGILHSKLESQFVFQQKTDILLLTHEAIKTISKRRSSEMHAQSEEDEKEYFLPHILGEILEETTFSVIPDVKITLLSNDKPAEMLDSIWKNPYKTNKATKGFFHFWPKLSDKELQNKKSNHAYKFTIVCSHPKFEEKRVNFELIAVNNQNLYKSFILPMILMDKLSGTDISFLSE